MKFPIFIDLEEKPIVVFGGGTIATRRIMSLLQFGARILVVSPTLSSQLCELHQNKRIDWICRGYVAGDCKNAYMVLSCTNDRKVNHSIYLEALDMKCYRNISDCKEECNFYFPGIASNGQVVVGVTANGTDHKLAKQVTDQIKEMI